MTLTFDQKERSAKEVHLATAYNQHLITEVIDNDATDESDDYDRTVQLTTNVHSIAGIFGIKQTEEVIEILFRISKS